MIAGLPINVILMVFVFYESWQSLIAMAFIILINFIDIRMGYKMFKLKIPVSICKEGI